MAFFERAAIPTRSLSKAQSRTLAAVGLLGLAVVCPAIASGGHNLIVPGLHNGDAYACRWAVKCGALLLLVAGLLPEGLRRRTGKRHQRGHTISDTEARVVSCAQVVGMCLGKKLRIMSKPAYIRVPSLVTLEEAGKAELWWRPRDFAEFLRLRVAIARGYAAVARRRGVKVGSDFPAEPVLSHESRMGLGLGRLKQMQENRRSYVASVLQEQEKQLECAGILTPVADGDDSPNFETKLVPATGVAFLLDHRRIAEAACRSSEQDCHAAIERAAKHHRRVCEQNQEHKRADLMQRGEQFKVVKTLSALPEMNVSWQRSVSSEEEQESSDGNVRGFPVRRRSASTSAAPVESERPTLQGARPTTPRGIQVPKAGEEHARGGGGLAPPQGPMQARICISPTFRVQGKGVPISPPSPLGVHCEGFGLSRDVLEKYGLSPTGRKLSLGLEETDDDKSQSQETESSSSGLCSSGGSQDGGDRDSDEEACTEFTD